MYHRDEKSIPVQYNTEAYTCCIVTIVYLCPSFGFRYLVINVINFRTHRKYRRVFFLSVYLFETYLQTESSQAASTCN